MQDTELSEVEESPSISRRELSAQLDRISENAAARITKREQALYRERTALAVIAEWVRIRSLEPVIAHCIDPDPVQRSQRLSYDLIGFACDIELATEKALANEPELQRTWLNIAQDKPVSANLRNKVLQACGRVYVGRGLEPWRYWQPCRRQASESRRAK